MVAACCTVRTFLPRLPSLSDLVDGRIYSIFGYDCRLPEFGHSLGLLPFDGRRMFVLADHLSWEDRAEYVRKGLPGVWMVGVSDPWKQR